MAKAIRILLIVSAALLLLGLGAALLLQSPAARNWLVERVSQALQRQVQVADLALDWGWPLKLRLSGVRVENPDWAGPEPLLQARALVASIDPLPLLRGRLDIERLHLEQPRLRLAERPQGEPNWRFGDGKADAGGGGLEVDLGELTIDDGLVRYVDPDSSTALQGSLQSVPGPGQPRLRLRARGSLRGAPLRLDLTAGMPPVGADAIDAYSLDLDADWGRTRIRLQGRAEDLAGLEGLEGRLRAQGPAAAEIAQLLGAPALALPAFELTGRLSHADTRWALSDFVLEAGDSRLAGSVSVDQGQASRLVADLRAGTLDLNQLGLGQGQQDAAAEQPAAQEAGWRQRWAERLAPLIGWSGSIDFAADRLIYGERVLDEVALSLSLEGTRLELDRLRVGGGLAGEGWVRVGPGDLQGAASLQLEQLPLAQLAGGSAAGTLSGRLNARLAQDTLSVSDSRLRYRQPQAQTDVSLQIEQNARQLRVQGAGEFRGAPLRLDLRGGSVGEALAGQDRYPLSLEGRLGETALSYRGSVRELAGLDGLRGRLRVQGPEAAELAELAGLPASVRGGIRLEGELTREGGRWALEGAQARLGGSTLQGDVAVEDDRGLRLRLRADELDLNELGLGPSEKGAGERAAAPQENGAGEAGKPAAARLQAEPGPAARLGARLAERLAPLLERPLDLDLEVGRLRYGRQVYDEVSIRAQRQGERLQVQRLSLAAGGGTVDARGWLGGGPGGVRGQIKARLRSVDLAQAWTGATQQDWGVLSGELDLRLTPALLQVRSADLDYRNRALELRLDLELQGLADGPGLRARGRGYRSGRPFRFALTGGPLEELISPTAPYPLRGDVFSLDTAAHLRGTLADPLRRDGGDFQLWLKGPDPADLYPLLGLSLPQLPPYQVRGRLRWQGSLVRFNRFDGRLGDSDIAGDLRVRAGAQPMVWATLYSDFLDVDDLFPVVGGEPAVGPLETASKEQVAEAVGEARDARVFPTETLSFERLHAVNARVRFTGKKVHARRLPMSALSFTAELSDGRLTLAPLRFGLGGGTVAAQLNLDATDRPPTGTAVLSLRRVNLRPMMEDLNLAEDSFGLVGGRGRFRFSGDSIAQAMASLDGELELVMEGGRLDMFAVEVAGLDLGEAVVAALSRDETVALNCAYARFDANDGLARLERFFIDTEDTNFTGQGQVDLDQEQLDLIFEAHPKDFSLFSFSSPVELEGRLNSLGADILSGEVVSRLVLAAVMAVIAPPAAVLPLLDTGRGEDAGPGCEQVLAEAQADPQRG